MYSRAKLFLVAMLVLSSTLYAHDYGDYRGVKVEGGFVVTWQVTSRDANSTDVEVTDEKGSSLVRIGVLKTVPDASRVSIYDVSARGNIIAIAAVFQSKKGNKQVRPTSSLMIFNVRGQLVSAVALVPSYAIRKLEVDDDANIWALGDHVDVDVDPSKVPMLVEYSPEGKIKRRLLPRNQFPLHAFEIKEGVAIGAPAMGFNGGIVWFWLPGSTDMVSVTTNDGNASVTKTNVPKSTSQSLMLLGVAREPSGDLVTQFREYDASRTDGRSLYYRWSASSGLWSQFKLHECDVASALVGADKVGQIYASRTPVGPKICRTAP